jgi:hypothetical protein
MDINGAKALKRRLGLNGAEEALPVAEPADIPAGAPPVYHWTGKTPRVKDSAETDDGSASPRSASLFSRLSPSLR